MSAEKAKKLLDIVSEIDDLYPDLDKVVMNDVDNPDYIIICSEEFAMIVAHALGDGGISSVLDENGEEMLDTEDDDDNGGILH